MDVGGVAVIRQLLKGQQNLVCFNCCRGFLTAKWWLTCGASLLLFSWRSPKGALRNILLNSCYHVRTIPNLFLNSRYHVMAAETLFLNSCHHVVAIAIFFCSSCHHVTANFWAKTLNSLAPEDACFRMRTTLGVVLIRSLVFHICVPECSRNGSGLRPYLWIQEKFV